MKKNVIIILIAGGMFLSFGAALIKLQNNRQKSQPPPAKEGKRKNREANVAQAFSLLDGVVHDAATWKDAATVRVLTEIARLTWSSNTDYARKSLRQAFDTVIYLVDEDKYVSPKYGGSLLQKVLALAAQKDPQMAEEFASKFQEAVSRQESKATTAKSRSKRKGSASLAAQELMNYAASISEQQPDLAVRLAESSLRSGISPDLASVVGRLRPSHPELAARVLTAAVNTLSHNPQTNVQDTLYVQAWIRSEDIGKHLSSAVLRQYFNAASRIVERDLNAMVTPVETSFMAMQLLPLYDQYAPERSALVRARLSDLRNHPDVQKDAEKQKQLQNRPRGPEAVEQRLHRARSAATSEEHDARLIGLASDLRRLGNTDRALAVLAEVNESEKKTNFQDLLLLMAVGDSIKTGKIEQSLTWARRIPTPPRRARALIEVAQRQADTGKREAAQETLNEARQILKAGPKTAERGLAFILAAMVDALLDSKRGFENLDESLVAANETPALKTLELAGEEIVIEDEGFTSYFLLPPPLKVDLNKGFAALADADFERSLIAAQSFNAKEIRADAIIAVAATLLDI